VRLPWLWRDQCGHSAARARIRGVTQKEIVCVKQ
jgi:hypothetical protein